MQRAAGSIGVLALQGGFAKHLEVLEKLKVDAHPVKTHSDLEKSCGLILPGGESTAMHVLIEKEKLKDPLLAFAQKKPVFGTCAGLILLAKWQLLDVAIERNAYGRQRASFSSEVTLCFGSIASCKGVFLRAPRIKKILSDKVKVLATNQNEIVMVEQGHFLGATFHPELTETTILHEYFVSLCKNSPEKQ